MTINQLLSFTFNETGVSVDDMKSPIRRRDFVRARALFSYLAKKCGFSFPAIAKELNRDHTTIIHLLKNAESNDSIKNIYNKYRQINIDTFNSVGGNSKTNQKKYSNIYQLYDYKCYVCGFDEVVEVHHIISVKKGGTNDPNNLILLCPNHHALADRGQLNIKNIHIDLKI